MKRILIIGDATDRAVWLKSNLEPAEFDIAGVLAWEQADEHSMQAAAADVIIVVANTPGQDTLEKISLLSAMLEIPVVVLDAQKDHRSIQTAMRAGVSAYVAHTVQVEDLSGIIQVAIARFAEQKRLHDELQEAKNQLAERKLVDCAKSILMADCVAGGFKKSSRSHQQYHGRLSSIRSISPHQPAATGAASAPPAHDRG
ncbi:MAG: hypothetical protein OEV15_10335 [Gallionella sp.]|nr:hypothetical protein [Gallionella sp.]